MNVGIVTDKLYVDKEVCWDVSGQHGNDHLEGINTILFVELLSRCEIY
jgi:hypothetical protein